MSVSLQSIKSCFLSILEVRGIPFDKNDEGRAIVPITGLKSSYAADFFYNTSEIFFVDSALERLSKIKTDGTGYRTIVNTGLVDPQGLAIDWIAQNIYIVDSSRDLIEVTKLF